MVIMNEEMADTENEKLSEINKDISDEKSEAQTSENERCEVKNQIENDDVNTEEVEPEKSAIKSLQELEISSPAVTEKFKSEETLSDNKSNVKEKHEIENSVEARDKIESDNKTQPNSKQLTSAQTPSSTNTQLEKNPFTMFQNKAQASMGTKSTPAINTRPTKSNANQTEASKIKETILNWCKSKTEAYQNVQISNFSSSWNNGMAFCALIHHFCPDAFDFDKLDPKNRKGNFELAFKVAEDKCDITPLLEAEDMVLMGNKPDSRCVFTYLSTMYQKLELMPAAKAAALAKKNEA